ncbi:DNA replication initiation factor cdc45 protein [Lasiodiplodia theobromae]|uniref:DNA replication initiation factor cdc45 protein n=1 Tax=Lasiodiplodia theobromae TaxID=45133 RepID=UPI0015C33358|nr:DNA replication initiation factor cdc45 protein [Lasiodiplodia theobromae]KAF4544973.1 DNA replication initiation factor cdc45 protein [Lasiodiplodia theobromae]
MGIPRLLHHMQDFGISVELGTAWQKATSRSPTEDLDEKHVVVDGPSLAYHAYHRAVAGRYHARNALEAMPSHAEVAETALHFLTTLESHGIAILGVFFDGALPAAKRDTRLKRLHSSLVQLQSFKNLHSDDVRCVRSRIDTNSFAAPTSVPEKLTRLPAAPFLVPAVIDRLKNSAFSDRVFVVPGEADIFCADVVCRVSQNKACWLLSSDTDLLVFDLGPKGSVLRFQDVSLATFPRRTVLKGVEYHPRSIAERLGLKALAPLAFSLTIDPHKSLQELVRAAKAVDSSTSEYQVWFQEYTPLHGISGPDQLLVNQYRSSFADLQGKSTLQALLPNAYEDVCLPSPQKRQTKRDTAAYLGYLADPHLRTMDPRISELVQQVCSAIVADTGYTKLHKPEGAGVSCAMFLPFLIDDPTRASAWRLSADLRFLGYSILSLPMCALFSMEEWERRGSRIAQSAVPRFSYKKAEIVHTCRELSAHITAFMVNSGDLHLRAPLHFWKLYGAMYLSDKLVQNEERQVSKNQVLRMIQGCQGQLEWSHIHHVAQLQGIWYSLRMLRQFLSVFLSFPTDGAPQAHKTDMHGDPEIQAAVKDLHERLEDLPTADRFFDPVPDDDEEAVPESYLLNAIENFPNLAPDPKEIYAAALEKSNGKKRKKKKQDQPDEQDKEEKADPMEQIWRNKFAALNRLADDI